MGGTEPGGGGQCPAKGNTAAQTRAINQGWGRLPPCWPGHRVRILESWPGWGHTPWVLGRWVRSPKAGPVAGASPLGQEQAGPSTRRDCFLHRTRSLWLLGCGWVWVGSGGRVLCPLWPLGLLPQNPPPSPAVVWACRCPTHPTPGVGVPGHTWHPSTWDQVADPLAGRVGALGPWERVSSPWQRKPQPVLWGPQVSGEEGPESHWEVGHAALWG